eukprot:6115896-Alexandrium_andersonii.AAC.1
MSPTQRCLRPQMMLPMSTRARSTSKSVLEVLVHGRSMGVGCGCQVRRVRGDASAIGSKWCKVFPCWARCGCSVCWPWCVNKQAHVCNMNRDNVAILWMGVREQ